jgi:hypothetical protein
MLAEALILDFNFLSRGCEVALDDPAEDTQFFWNEEVLAPDLMTTAASVAAGGTTITVNSGHGPRVHIGDLLRDLRSGSAETLQVTDQVFDTLTVTRGYAGTTPASIAAGATLVIQPAYQEASDIGQDKSQKPIARSNFTQIVFAGDLQISGSQLSRQMATIAMDVNRQLANKAKELTRAWSNLGVYGEKSVGAGSDTFYRTTGGLRSWIRDTPGVLDPASTQLTYSNLNSNNTAVVNRGEYVDTLLIGTDLVNAVSAIDASNRRLVESDTHVGYFVEKITLGQGNEVEVVVDSRVMPGDAFLYPKAKLRWRPLTGRAMFVIAATDFVDGTKRRIGSEAGMECRQPEAMAYLSNKTP